MAQLVRIGWEKSGDSCYGKLVLLIVRPIITRVVASGIKVTPDCDVKRNRTPLNLSCLYTEKNQFSES